MTDTDAHLDRTAPPGTGEDRRRRLSRAGRERARRLRRAVRDLPQAVPALPRRVLGPARRHRAFTVLLGAAIVLRVVTMLALRPAEIYWYDSYEYLGFALNPRPTMQLHPGGYGLFLWLLKPFHSIALVAAVQHLLGLGAGVLVYAVLRRRSVPGWGAVLAAVPALLDVQLLHLEHAVFSDTLLIALVTAALAVLLWSPEVSARAGALAGLLLALAALTRTIAVGLLVLVLAWLVIRRIGWRPVAAVLVTAAIPLTLYAGWYHSTYGRYALTGGDGVALWARTMTFANCKVIKPPPAEAGLCPNGIEQEAASEYFWAADSPINLLPGGRGANDELARSFAIRAIKAQPWDYAKAVAGGVSLAFRWPPSVHLKELPAVYYFHEGRAPLSDNQQWGRAVVEAYDPSVRDVHTVRPYAQALRFYQGPFFLPGPLLALLLVAGALGIRRAEVLLPWAFAMSLLVVPVAVTDFDHRYVLPVIPPACLAAALSLPGLAGWFRRRRERSARLLP